METDSESVDSESTIIELPQQLAQLLECVDINSDNDLDGLE